MSYRRMKPWQKIALIILVVLLCLGLILPSFLFLGFWP